jgi:predicted membrane-bound spermidine synthase
LNNSKLQRPVLLVIFVLSGFAALIYQSIWSHYLGLFLGHAAYAQALVLALFMGGMAAGAGLVARFGVRWFNLLRGYAVIEAVIGVLGLGFHFVFVNLLGLSYDHIMPALGQPWLVNSFKWLLAIALILPQTILLGMTFPLMSGGLIRRSPGRDGIALGGLYFANSAGAALGVLVATFVLLPEFGLPGSMVAAGLINLAVAVVAWGVSAGRETPRLPETNRAGPLMIESRRLLRLVIFATLLSSAASFAYEIMFVRMLSLAVGSTLHAFELMLGSFIAGIALGALWVRRHADQTRSPLRLVGLMQILMGLTALLALALYAGAFAWVGFLVESLTNTDGGYSLFNLGTAAIAILIMMPTAFFAGTTLPLFTIALLRDGQGEASIGRVYAWNTLGAILGVVAAIHFLVPVMGLKLGMIIAATVDIAIGITALRFTARDRKDLLGVGGGVLVLLGATWVVVNLVPFDALRLSSGVYRSGQASLPESSEVVFYRDGKTASISVVYSADGRLRIATNGKVDAAVQTLADQPPTLDEPTMIVAGVLPLAYKENPQTAAVIGFGSGLTTHALLGDRTLERVDTIEIERQMVEGARWFDDRVARAYDDPRSHIVIDDAKSFFAGQQRRYDVVVSEPSNPWISGVGALFSQEFYRFVPRFLSEDGIFLQWLQLYEIDEQLVGSVLNALVPEFSGINAYLANTADLLLVASPSDLTPEPKFQKLMTGGLGAELAHMDITSPEHLEFRRVADRTLLKALARLYKSEPNSDYYPILSLEAPRTRFRNLSAGQIFSLPNLRTPLLEWLGVRRPPPAELLLPKHDHFPADTYANEAREIRGLLLSGNVPEGLEPGEQLQRWVEELSIAADVCESFSIDMAGNWLSLRLLELTETTLPYLDAEGLEGVLVNPQWLDCDQLPDGIAAAAALVEAHAQRDTQRMVALGERWLQDLATRPHYVERFDQFAFATYQFGLIGQGRYEEAREAESRFGSDVRAAGDYGQARSVLLAWLSVVLEQQQDK